MLSYNRGMKLLLSDHIFEKFDNPRIGIVIAKDINNKADISDFEPGLMALAANIEKEFGQQVISQLPKIAAWREAYRVFGVKAKEYPSSVEALYKRVSK